MGPIPGMHRLVAGIPIGGVSSAHAAADARHERRLDA